MAQGHTVKSQGSQDPNPDSVGQSHIPEGSYGLIGGHRQDTGKGKGGLWRMLSRDFYFGDREGFWAPKTKWNFDHLGGGHRFSQVRGEGNWDAFEEEQMSGVREADGVGGWGCWEVTQKVSLCLGLLPKL